MNSASLRFIKQNWQLIFHKSAKDFQPVIDKTSLASLQAIVTVLKRDNWRTLNELAEVTGLNKTTVAEITAALERELFERFLCPDPDRGRGDEVAVGLLKTSRFTR
jgi:DNA-binding MarR family transcriptional regulator